MDALEEAQRAKREEKIAEFAFTGLLTAIQGHMGQSLPVDEDARDLVRVARVVYDEIDSPTERKDDTPRTPPGERPVEDWQDGLWIDQQEGEAQ